MSLNVEIMQSIKFFQGTKCGRWFVTTARMQLVYEALRSRSHMLDGSIIVPHLNSWKPWFLCRNTVSRESPTTAESHGSFTPGVSAGLSLSVFQYASTFLKEHSILDILDWFCQVDVSFLTLLFLNYETLIKIRHATLEENFAYVHFGLSKHHEKINKDRHFLWSAWLNNIGMQKDYASLASQQTYVRKVIMVIQCLQEGRERFWKAAISVLAALEGSHVQFSSVYEKLMYLSSPEADIMSLQTINKIIIPYLLYHKKCFFFLLLVQLSWKKSIICFIAFEILVFSLTLCCY